MKLLMQKAGITVIAIILFVSGCPGTLLASNASFVYPSVTGAWVALDVPDYTILSSGNYWLAITSDGTINAGIGMHQQAGIPNYAYGKNTTELPLSLGAGCSYDYNYPNTGLMVYASCE
jgi:hypothetical protein